MKIEELQVTSGSEIVKAKKTTRGKKMTEGAKARKDALSLTIFHEGGQTKEAIVKILCFNNVVSIWFPKEVRKRHNGIANM